MGAKFDKLEAKLEGEPGVTDAAGLAASIGRKKYGKANYDKAASKDKSPKMKKADDEMDDNDEDVEKGAVRASPKLWSQGSGSGGKPKAGGSGVGKRVTFESTGIKQPPKGARVGRIGKSEVDEGVDGMAKAMELMTTENPVHEIKKSILELGPEGLRKALPNMTEENKGLLGEILEDMSKSHTLPLDAPKKLVNVGGENYVEEDVGNDDADEDIFDASVKEKDYEQKHQGGAHDMEPKAWEGQIIKSILELEDGDDVLEGLETIYDAWEMRKAKDKLEKVSASPKLWGTTKPRGVGIYKGEEDDTVAEDVAEIKGDKKVNEVMDEAAPDKKDDILRELRDKKIKKAKELIKAALKKECPDMMEEKEDVEVMKKKIKKALIMALNEEITDEEVEKAMEGGMGPSAGAVGAGAAKKINAKAANTGAGQAKGIFKAEDEDMDKGGPGSGKKGHQTDAHGASYDKAGFHNPSKKAQEQKKIDKYNRGAPVKEIDPKTGEVMAEHKNTAAAKRAAKMKKAMEMFAEAGELLKGIDEADQDRYRKDEKYDKDEAAESYEGRDEAEKEGDSGKAAKEEKDIEADMTDADYDKDKSEGKKQFEKAQELFLKAKSMIADVLEMNPGIKKLSQPEVASAAKTTADAVKSPNMKKSIKWYGEENDTFKAGRLGRHGYSSSVNSYYDEVIKKSEEVKEEELKKSFDSNDLNDLIEAEMTGTWLDAQDNMNFKKSEAGMGNFTRHSFDESDLLKSLGMTKEEADKL